MPSFFVNRSLSRGDLTLLLRNGMGLPQDGFDVRWTVYRKDGQAASGLRVPATKATTGEYYAPWGCAQSGGCYYVRWDYKDAPGGLPQTWCQDFFVLEGSGCCTPCAASPANSQAAIDCGAFYSGQTLGPGDLCLQVVDDDGLPAQAYMVFWTIYDCRGCPISPRTQATMSSTLGTYCAFWTVCGFGNETIKWEWMLDSDSPMESACSCFTVVNPPALFSVCEVPVPKFNYCPPAPPQVIVVNDCCDGASIPRTVVLTSQVLPAGGVFTNQPSYSVPAGIRHVSFYVKYTHGVPGGYAVVRLMWGNGTEETQSTIINASFATFDGKLATNQARLNDLVGPIPDSDDPIYFLIESSVPGGATTTRLLIAEGGVPGIPGTAEITLTGSSS